MWRNSHSISKLYSQPKERTCSSLQQGPCVQISDLLYTPFPWQFADTFPGELTEHEKSVIHNTAVHNMMHTVEYPKVIYNVVDSKTSLATYRSTSLVPRPCPAFRCLQYGIGKGSKLLDYIYMYIPYSSLPLRRALNSFFLS